MARNVRNADNTRRASAEPTSASSSRMMASRTLCGTGQPSFIARRSITHLTAVVSVPTITTSIVSLASFGRAMSSTYVMVGQFF